VTLETLHSLIELLPTYGERRAAGLRQEFGARWWSYQRLYQETFGVAALLKRRGVRPGERIVLWAPNTPEWVAFFLGASLRGVVVVPVDEGSSPTHVRQLVEQVDAVLVAHGPAQDISWCERATQPLSWQEDELRESSFEDLAVPVGPNDPAVILYTSGTTSQPKGVVLTHGNLVSEIEPFRAWRWLLRIIPCRVLSLSPLSHTQGLMLGLCVPLAIGLSVLYSASVDPMHVIRTIRQQRVTLLVAVPRIQHLLVKTLRQRPYERQGLTLGERVRTIRSFLLRRHILFLATHAEFGYWFWALLVGGAALPPDDERFWFESGYFLAQGYGLTETTAIVSINLITPFFGHLGSIGKPLQRQKVRLAEDGEILVGGPNVSPGYAEGSTPEDQVFTDRNGFLHTGDLARQDSSGRLYFVGRKKDIIVTGEGFNVYPDEVEAVLNRMAEVRDAVVIGLEQDGHEEVHAVLLLNNGADAADVVRRANTELEPHQTIRGWTVWPGGDFPRTSLLKAKRQAVTATVQRWRSERPLLRPAAESRPTLQAIREATSRNQRLALLAQYLTRLPAEQRTAEQLRLVGDLGLSSLDLIELLTLMEATGQVDLQHVAVAEDATLADLGTLARMPEPARSRSRLPAREPGWSRGPIGSLVRAVTQPFLIGVWASLCARVVPTWPAKPLTISQPFILAAAPHRHWLDGFAVYAALPRHLRKRLMVVTNRDFHEYFAPSPGVPLSIRLLVGLVYHVLMPLVFRFTILPGFGTTRVGLYETGALLDRGYSLITFPKGFFFLPQDVQHHDPGVALMAIQTQLPILPVWFDGNHALRLRPRRNRPRIEVHFGEPIPVTPDMTPGEVIAKVEAAFARMA